MWLQGLINESMAMEVVIQRSAEYLDPMSNYRGLPYSAGSLAKVPNITHVKVTIMSIVSPGILWKFTTFCVHDEAKLFSYT